jgi:hypothetical protein
VPLPRCSFQFCWLKSRIPAGLQPYTCSPRVWTLLILILCVSPHHVTVHLINGPRSSATKKAGHDRCTVTSTTSGAILAFKAILGLRDCAGVDGLIKCAADYRQTGRAFQLAAEESRDWRDQSTSV